MGTATALKLPTMEASDLDRERLIQMVENPLVLPSVDEAFEISKKLRIGIASEVLVLLGLPHG